jgi:hypothetical protein
MSLVLPATVREQPRPLPQRDDPAGPLLRRLCERCPRHTVVAGKGDQLLDVAIRVVPLFDQVRQVVRLPVDIYPDENETGTTSSLAVTPASGECPGGHALGTLIVLSCRLRGMGQSCC